MNIVLFPIDATASSPKETPIDPSMTCYDLGLGDNSALYLTIEPCGMLMMTDHSAGQSEQHWHSLTTASLRFGECGANLQIEGKNKRRVFKTAADGWSESTATSSVCLSDELNKFSFCISTIAHQHRVVGISAAGAAPSMETTMPMGAATAEEKFGIGSVDLPQSDYVFPTLMVGVADASIPLDGDQNFQTYPNKWLFDVAAGAYYSGTDARPTYVDSQGYQFHLGMVITFFVDTERGALNIVYEGRNVLAAQIPRHLSDSLHPCVEIYTKGGVVDFV